MIDARFRYFADPKRHKTRKRAQFRTTYAKILDKLEYELKRVSAKEVTIEAGFAQNNIRNDGWPRSGAKVEHPAVVLHFTSKGSTLSFPSDAHDSFEQNLYAIALTLEALRAVDRHGVSQGTEQYTGFAQLAAPGESESLKWAAETVLTLSGYPNERLQQGWAQDLLKDKEIYTDAFRRAARRTHPDAGGKREEFDELMRAAAIVDEHFKSKQQASA